MGKKILLCLLGVGGLFTLVYGCQNIAVEMSDSEMLYRAKCSSCHNVIAANRYDQEKWSLYIDEYGKKMTNDEKRIVLEYLIAPY